MAEINPKMIYGRVTIKACPLLLAIKPYGVYTRNGVKRMKDYGRTLKNGKGMNIYDAWGWQLEEANKRLKGMFY